MSIGVSTVMGEGVHGDVSFWLLLDQFTLSHVTTVYPTSLSNTQQSKREN